ncbi:MAG: hypothetical protein MJ135_00810 [Oscillospiraceae bacterium]|nr:hypothetical protein [Oscillospiraceae bacterium]
MKRILLAILILLAGLTAGCAIYDKEYYTVEDYVIPATQQSSVESVSVKNLAQLNRAMVRLVHSAATEGRIVFDSDYEGNISADLNNISMQVRTQDAICAYCVKEIQFELTKIVSYYEASINISYYDSAAKADEIITQQYAIGVDELLLHSMDNNENRLVLCIANSTLTKSAVESKVMEVYRSHPLCALMEPEVSVFTYSGAGKQRLYEINFDYGLDSNEILRRKAQLKNLDLGENIGLREEDDLAQKVYSISRYVMGNCSLSTLEPQSTVYDALIQGSATDEGISLAFYEICTQLNMECYTVYGQKNGTAHVWNIVRLDDAYYHVDLAACISEGLAEGFLKNDMAMLNVCRWNTASYPACTGEPKKIPVEETRDSEYLNQPVIEEEQHEQQQ